MRVSEYKAFQSSIHNGILISCRKVAKSAMPATRSFIVLPFSVKHRGSIAGEGHKIRHLLAYSCFSSVISNPAFTLWLVVVVVLSQWRHSGVRAALIRPHLAIITWVGPRHLYVLHAEEYAVYGSPPSTTVVFSARRFRCLTRAPTNPKPQGKLIRAVKQF